MVKRSVDIAISAALLLLFLPVLLLAALVICVTSPGPVLFRQMRMGRSFQPFEIFKLRTMVHAEAGLAFTLGHDPRITPFGSFLRRSKLDELPQLWNVLRGEMSLVGPRPVLPELAFEFREDYAFLLRAKPGLTDPASLKYSQETRLLARAADPMRIFKTVVTPDKIRISFEYMTRANFWTDTVTLCMTAAVCCVPSLSRVYGELPEVRQAPVRPQLVPGLESGPVSGLVPRLVAAAAPTPVDASIFAYDLAFLEAAVENANHLQGLPWIHLPNRNFEPRTASAKPGRNASRL